MSDFNNDYEAYFGPNRAFDATGEKALDTFAAEPETLGEHRAHKTRAANDWAPRDLLVKMLRDHDSGEVPLESLVVAYRARGHSGYWAACKDPLVAMGLLVQAQSALAFDGLQKARVP